MKTKSEWALALALALAVAVMVFVLTLTAGLLARCLWTVFRWGWNAFGL